MRIRNSVACVSEPLMLGNFRIVLLRPAEPPSSSPSGFQTLHPCGGHWVCSFTSPTKRDIERAVQFLTEKELPLLHSEIQERKAGWA